MATNSLAPYLDKHRGYIEKTLGHKSDQFIANVVALTKGNPKLLKCDKESLMTACITATALDLPINSSLGVAWVVPYNEKGKGLVAQFQLGYKGLIQLAQRSGNLHTINATDVREGEYLELNHMTGEYNMAWVDDVEMRNGLPVIGYMAYFETNTGFAKALYMSNEAIGEHAGKYSSSYRKGYGVWFDQYDAMAKKTVLKLLLSRYAPMTPALAQAIEADQSAGGEWVDNMPTSDKDRAREKEVAKMRRFIESADSIDSLEQCEPTLFDELRELYDQRHAVLSGETPS